MPPEPPTSAALALRRRGGACGDRVAPFAVGPRRLGYTLIEFAIGGAWQVEDLDAGVRFEAGAGQVFVVPAARRHALRMAGGGRMRSHWWLGALEDEFRRDAFTLLPHALLLPPAASRRAAALLGRLSRGADVAAGVAAQLQRQRLGLELASIVMAQRPDAGAGATRPLDPRVEAVARWVRGRLHLPVTRHQMARVAHLSPTRFHYVFVAAIGVAPLRFVAQERLRAAQRLLLDSTLSSKEVGARCGLASPTSFARAFARETGMSPLAYRAQMRGTGGPGQAVSAAAG